MTEKKEFPKDKGRKLKTLDKVRLACAESLIKTGVKVDTAIRKALKEYPYGLSEPLDKLELKDEIDRLRKVFVARQKLGKKIGVAGRWRKPTASDFSE